MYNGNLLYTLEREKKIADSILIEKLSFNNPVRQIRA